nr:RNA-dependent RNA polymerase [Strawberry virus 3]
MGDMCLDDDIDCWEEESVYDGTQNESTDRGGQFHLQSAILPMMSMLPNKTVSRFQEKMIRAVCAEADNHNVNYDQIKLFADYMSHCEASTEMPFPKDIKQMAVDILSRECEVFESLLSEEDLKADILRIISGTTRKSQYIHHIQMIQKAVYIYNILLSQRLGDQEIKQSHITTILGGRGAINDDNTVVTYNYEDDGWCLYITREVIGWSRRGDLIITGASMLLNICDKLQERFNIQLISQVGSKISPIVYPSWDKVLQFIRWGDSVVADLGNEGYGLLANFESLMVSQLIKKEEDGFDNGRFQANILADIYEDGIFYKPYVDQLLLMIDELSHFHIAQLHGLYRIWGHPEVDAEAGMRKVGDLLHQKKHPDPDLENIGRLTFREVFVTNYFKKHGFYPPMEWVQPSNKKQKLKKESSYIKGRIESNTEIDLHSIHYNREGWNSMKFLPCFPVPTGMNIASFLKDKAVSPDRDDLIHMITTTSRVTDPYKRRGVLKWLSTQPINIPKLLESINNNPTGLPKNDCTIGLYPKERELKLQARMFALMAYKMRIYFVMTEEMLSHHVLPYFPQIAMNDNFLAIQKKFVDFTTPMSGIERGAVTYIVNIDFKKWNQQMRKEITLGIFTDLGSLFGLPQLYNRTYDIFMNSFVYLCNGTFTPKVINGALKPQYPLSWEGDQGGKEGLRQKGWTIVSAMDLYAICKEHHFTFKIIGGGDNQVLVITMPSISGARERTHRRMERFLEDLDEKMRRRGLPLKIGETWVSSSLFAYNKYMIYKGVQLPSTLKLASRCFHLSNTDLMTIENMTSTLAVSYQSIISKDFSLLTGWIFSRINLAYHMNAIWEHHPFLGRSIPAILIDRVKLSGVQHFVTFKNKMTKQILYYMTVLFPRVLGGSGTINLFSYLSRGFPDGLSEWCSYLYLMEGGKISDLDLVIKKVLSPTKRSMPSYSRLLEDPTSLSLDSAEIGSGALRNIASLFLEKSDRITNKGFKQFLEASSKEDVEAIAEILCTGKYIIPRELHDIVGSTIYGYLNSVLSKIDKSTTINKLGEGVNILNDIRRTECNWINYCAYRLTVQHSMSRLPCATRTAEKWRNESWGKEIIGVTTPHPSAFLVASPGKFHNGCDGNFIMHVNLYRKGVDEPYAFTGPCRPYLGSYTREKSLGTELASAYGNESLVRRPIHLQKLIGWRYEKTGCMAKILRKCLESVTDVPGEFFESDPRCVTGDAEHRYKDKATKHEGVINNLYYWSTWCRTLTDSFTKHSRGGKNETLQFQVCMLYINALSAMVNEGCRGNLLYFSRLKNKHLGEVHFHEKCHTCIVPLKDPSERDIAPKMFPPIPSCPTNKYLYVKKEDMKFSYAEMKEIEEADGTMLHSSILESYDGRTALSLITGCMLGRIATGSRHDGEKMTESTWRLIFGKVDALIMLNGMVNYIIAWKFMIVMTRGNSVSSSESSLLYHVTERSHLLESYFSMCLSYKHQKSALQHWCQSNDTGIILEDLDVGPVIHEIMRRIQLNSSRKQMIIHKTRGESLDKEERTIRAYMGLKYVAVECSECQNYVRQYMKNNIAKRCLCPHEELRGALSSPMLVWPEGIESLSKKVDNIKHMKNVRLPREGRYFMCHHITSTATVSNTTKRCVKVSVAMPPVVHNLSNFPLLYQASREILLATKDDCDEVCLVDTYDGHMERMISRNMLKHDGLQCLRLFRHKRPDYQMMKGYMTGDRVFYRMEDTLGYINRDTIFIIEVESTEEIKAVWSHEDSDRAVIIFQVHTEDTLMMIKYLCSVSSGLHLRIVRLSESICGFILTKFRPNKVYQCVDDTTLEAMVNEAKAGMMDIQSIIYDSWNISSSTKERGSMAELADLLFGNLIFVTKEQVKMSWRKLLSLALSHKEKKEYNKVHYAARRYLMIISLLSSDPSFLEIDEHQRYEISYPNKIRRVDIRDDDNCDYLSVTDIWQLPNYGGEIMDMNDLFRKEEDGITFLGGKDRKRKLSDQSDSSD